MTQPIVQYCENCGKPLNSQARFCGRCGKPVRQAQAPASTPQQPYSPPTVQPPAPLPPVEKSTTSSPRQPVSPNQAVPSQYAPQPQDVAQSAEFIMSALPMGSQRSGFLGMRAKGLIMVLTNMRILVVQQTSELMKENARLAKENAKQSGKGFFSQWGAVIGSNSSERYLQMHPQQILNETPGNYFIANNQVRSVRIKEYNDPEGGINETRLIIDTVGSKIELIYTTTGKRELKKALQQTLGNIVR